MNIIRIFLFLLIGLASLPGQEEALYEWFGEGALPDPNAPHPSIVKGELGDAQELQFTCSGNPGEANYFSPSFPEGVYKEFTIALFIKPERKRANENLLYLAGQQLEEGFILRKSWTMWGVHFGRDNDRKVHYSKKLESQLTINEWNHIAVTFNEGVLKFYKNGLLVDVQTCERKEITLSSKNIFRIGSGSGSFPKIYDGYQGRMGAISLSLCELDEDQIHKLMERATP